jgi:hypothetical protein
LVVDTLHLRDSIVIEAFEDEVQPVAFLEEVLVVPIDLVAERAELLADYVNDVLNRTTAEG